MIARSHQAATPRSLLPPHGGIAVGKPGPTAQRRGARGRPLGRGRHAQGRSPAEGRARASSGCPAARGGGQVERDLPRSLYRGADAGAGAGADAGGRLRGSGGAAQLEPCLLWDEIVEARGAAGLDRLGQVRDGGLIR